MAVMKGMTDQRMSNQLMDIYKDIIVPAGSITVGPETAMIMLEDVRDMLQRSLARLQKTVDNAQGVYNAKAVNDAAKDGEGLYALMQRYNGIIEAMGARDGDQPGQIADGPNGEKLIFDGTDWVPYDGQ